MMFTERDSADGTGVTRPKSVQVSVAYRRVSACTQSQPVCLTLSHRNCHGLMASFGLVFPFPAEIQGQEELSSEHPELTGDGQKVYSGTWLRLRVGDGMGSSGLGGAQVAQTPGLPTAIHHIDTLN